MRKVIILGHRGQIGSHLYNNLSREYKVCGYSLEDNYDISDENILESIISENSDAYAVINAALSRSELIPVKQMNSEFLKKYFENNLFPNFNIIKFAQKYLKDYRLIFFSSIASLGMKDNSHYSAVKASLESLVKSASIELNNTDNRLYCIRLGVVEIDKSAFSPKLKIQHDNLQNELLKKTIGNKKITKDEISDLIELLLNNNFNSFHSDIIPLTSGYGLL